MEDQLQIRRKRLKFRAAHRGTKELDLYVGGFAAAHLDEMSAADLDLFEAMLESDEVSIFAWITGTLAPPAEHDHHVMQKFLEFDVAALLK